MDPISIALQVIMAVLPMIQDSDLMDAILKSDEITDEQRQKITALRKATVEEWNSLAPKI